MPETVAGVVLVTLLSGSAPVVASFAVISKQLVGVFNTVKIHDEPVTWQRIRHTVFGSLRLQDECSDFCFWQRPHVSMWHFNKWNIYLKLYLKHSTKISFPPSPATHTPTCPCQPQPTKETKETFIHFVVKSSHDWWCGRIVLANRQTDWAPPHLSPTP